MKNPLVSIIIPTYSRPNNLCRAIESVLHQTYSPIEIIVVDDNGEGTPYQIETEKLLNKYINTEQIRYIKHKVNKNGSAARNTGVRHSNGTLIGLMDDDDIFVEDKIELQVKSLLSDNSTNNKAVYAYCNMQLRYPNDIEIRTTTNTKQGDLSKELLEGKLEFNSSTLLIKKESFQAINGFDETFFRHQDWEFVLRLMQIGEAVMCEPERYLVVKYETPNAAVRQPIKSCQATDYFLNKFAYLINSLDSSKDIYRFHYRVAARFLFTCGEFWAGIKYAKKMNSYGKLSLYEIGAFIKAYLISH